MPEKHANVPAQKKGAESNVAHHIKLADVAEAKNLYEVAKSRLLHVSDWKQVSKGISAEFQLMDSSGQKVNRPAQEHDYFKIDIAAPGTKAGDGSDWVQIESILHENNRREDYECISMRVRPSADPQNTNPDIAHFFDQDATSTFMVLRKGRQVSAEVHGRNESPNTGTKNIWDTIRNFFMGLGAMLGFSKPQWKGLVKGLLSR
jgi:hypothetical protein